MLPENVLKRFPQRKRLFQPKAKARKEFQNTLVTAGTARWRVFDTLHDIVPFEFLSSALWTDMAFRSNSVTLAAVPFVAGTSKRQRPAGCC